MIHEPISFYYMLLCYSIFSYHYILNQESWKSLYEKLNSSSVFIAMYD